MPFFQDQIGRSFELKEFPRRIVSLVPSQTEMLIDLGLENNIVGITKFCVHPDRIRSEKIQVGGTKNLHLDRVEILNPDFIIANKEENTRADVEALAKKYPVYVSDIENLNDAKGFALDMGALTGNEDNARKLVAQIDQALSHLQDLRKNTEPLSVLYLIWKDPYMAAGTDSFITEMLHICGVNNVLHKWGDKGLRYPEVRIDQIKSLNPDMVLLSSEPYPFKRKHAEELSEKTGIKNMLVDGEIFSWYGSRIIHTLPHLEKFMQEIGLHFR